MYSDEEDDPMLKAAIEASLRDDSNTAPLSEDHGNVAPLSEDHGNVGLSSPEPPSKDVVDLTYDSDDQSAVQEVFQKSNSMVGPDTDDEAEQDMHVDDEDQGMQDDEEDLRRAIAMSLQDSQDADFPSTGGESAGPTLSKSHSPPRGLLGLDRKQMEQERLARMKKRKPEDSVSPPGQPRTKLHKAGSESTKTLSAHDSSTTSHEFSLHSSPSTVRPTARPAIQWPLGAVRKTHVANTDRGPDEITIEEVVQRSDLQLGVFSSFLWDMEWFFTKCDTWRTRFLLIMHAKEQELRDTMIADTKDMKNIRLCFPPMNGQITTMHSKLMLLFHTNYMRIAIPTANLTRTDWGEDRLMENTVFLIDLPKKESNGIEYPKTFFNEELLYFLKASTVHESVIAKLDDYDFTETARYAFVHTIGGSSGPGPDDLWRRTGYCGLGRAVKHLGLGSLSPINVDYVASSIGSLNNEFIRTIYLACKGDDGLADYTMRYAKSGIGHTDPEQQTMIQTSKEWQGRFHVYFPSDDTVHCAHDIPENTAGTVCFQSRWWQGGKFPREIMRDCISKKPVLMHNKLIYVWPAKPILLPNNRECKGWAYIGSANISESAWGRLVKDRQTNRPKLNCRNWECGVLVPVTTKAPQSLQDAELRDSRPQPRDLPAEIFENTIPVPMIIPAPSLDDQLKPWFFMGED
ncbi:hypothetical protein N7520_003436 [Penicillium odoratum]|uniref:uncharacterized protein n=1 Tax=Penicillium odoratum TaxID=1167516 RepID=UPI0025486EFE|nr:uncharacterized protein N7520_003436 [Penicillium odoratum]KAJ5768877.1 hypothetical protein N7520_003436 [Penicillium odoratum]